MAFNNSTHKDDNLAVIHALLRLFDMAERRHDSIMNKKKYMVPPHPPLNEGRGHHFRLCMLSFA